MAGNTHQSSIGRITAIRRVRYVTLVGLFIRVETLSAFAGSRRGTWVARAEVFCFNASRRSSRRRTRDALNTHQQVDSTHGTTHLR
jgi:hypothetical protein